MVNKHLLGLDAWLTPLLTTIAIAIVYFLTKGYQARSMVNRLRRANMVIAFVAPLILDPEESI